LLKHAGPVSRAFLVRKDINWWHKFQSVDFIFMFSAVFQIRPVDKGLKLDKKRPERANKDC
jgi:hypothetical protein